MHQPVLTSKPHYQILDGLRGVAAIVVVIFHIFEAHASSHFDQVVNHGYLAVDFFFALSGYVVGYAYDDRWTTLNFGSFFKRRLIRLHPMLVMGMLVGAACFYFQDSVMFPNIHDVPVSYLLLTMLVGFTLLPIPPAYDIRGWREMYPLDGPAWTLFFEYFANILYGLIVRKFPNWLLSICVFICAAVLLHMTTTNHSGDVVGGWSLDLPQLRIGITRVMYPFFAGLLLFRISKPTVIKKAFLWCSLLILIILFMPRIGTANNVWLNGLYESACIIILFPFIVWMGASGTIAGEATKKLCKLLGDISYPIYITHYPLIYIYTGWVADGKLPISQAYPQAIATFVGAIAIAWLSLRFYDLPVRKLLNRNK